MVFQNVMLCSLAEVYQHFRGACCLHFMSLLEGCKQEIPYKHRHLSAKLCGITTDTLQMPAPIHQTKRHHNRHLTNTDTYSPNYMASQQIPYKCWHLSTKLHGITTDTLQMLAFIHQTTWQHNRYLTNAGIYPPNYMAS